MISDPHTGDYEGLPCNRGSKALRGNGELCSDRAAALDKRRLNSLV